MSTCLRRSRRPAASAGSGISKKRSRILSSPSIASRLYGCSSKARLYIISAELVSLKLIAWTASFSALRTCARVSAGNSSKGISGWGARKKVVQIPIAATSASDAAMEATATLLRRRKRCTKRAPSCGRSSRAYCRLALMARHWRRLRISAGRRTRMGVGASRASSAVWMEMMASRESINGCLPVASSMAMMPSAKISSAGCAGEPWSISTEA